MASLDKHYKANGARLSQLLIDKGTEAMRNVFDAIHPPSNLTAVLASRKSFLVKLRCINPSQREILFPSSGTPSTSKDFDITLLYILLRNICGLRPPVSTGSWVNNPPSTDTSTEANVARIKYYRNAVYGHITTTGIDDVNFQSHWNNISTALISLGISHGDIESLRYTPLEEDVYVNSIRKLESVMLNRLDGVESLVKQRVDILEEAVKKEVNDGVLGSNDKNIQSQQNIIDKLSKCNVKGDIVKLTKKFHKGSRKWLLDKVDNWFTDQESDSKVMILTAGPGVGKSVFAAKVCQVYQEKGLLAAGHFCKFNYTDLRNPKSMLESLSSHMCDNVPGFKEKLVDQLRRHHSMDTITDTFRVLLNDPLHALNEREPMMIVIDGLDESETNGKSELLDLLAKDFPDLPGCVKIFITSRPELPVREKLAYLNPVEIKPGDVNNDQDLNDFLGKHLSEVKLEKNAVTRLVKKCQGSFLFANHVVLYLTRQIKNESSMVVDVEGCVPTSISSVYQEYFDRLKKELAPLFLGKTEHFFQNILEILTAARGPLPLSVVAEVLELPADTHQMKEVIRKMNERLSALLDIDDDCLTVFHKSVVDWLLSEGYDDHPYTVDETSGHRHLWLACRKKLETENTSTEQSRRQEKGDEYAKRHGIDHLEWLTTLGLHESWKIPGKFFLYW